MEKFNEYDPLVFQGIAHRGLWNKDYTENGMKAFENAVKNNCAFELDIHLTLDGELVVCHDQNLVRTTGKEGLIEHLTLKEIKDNYRLFDGGEIPTMKEVLDMTDERVPIVVELKIEEKNYKALGKKAKEFFLKENIKDTKKITFISFDPRALTSLGKVPFTKGLLICEEYSKMFMVRRFFDNLDVETTLTKAKQTVSFRKKGHPINVWTVETEEVLNNVIDDVDMVTFQAIPLEMVRKAIANKTK